jgi:hypothetical protein
MVDWSVGAEVFRFQVRGITILGQVCSLPDLKVLGSHFNNAQRTDQNDNANAFRTPSFNPILHHQNESFYH